MKERWVKVRTNEVRQEFKCVNGNCQHFKGKAKLYYYVDCPSYIHPFCNLCDVELVYVQTEVLIPTKSKRRQVCV